MLVLAAGDTAVWSITAIGDESRETGGRFWLLDAEAASRLEESEGIVGRIEDMFAQGVARALARAQHGLFDEAVSDLEKELLLTPQAGRRALVHRALVVVLAQMQDSLAERSNTHAELWIQHRLASHRGELESGPGRP